MLLSLRCRASVRVIFGRLAATDVKVGSVCSSDYFFALAESSTSMAEALDDLRAWLTGDVLVEGDREYERARSASTC